MAHGLKRSDIWGETAYIERREEERGATLYKLFRDKRRNTRNAALLVADEEGEIDSHTR